MVANGGMLVRPRLISIPAIRVRSPERRTVCAVFKPETATIMRQMMQGVVLNGTGRAARCAATAGGKDGIGADLRSCDEDYTHKYNASFMGFSPVNRPAIVVVVTLNGASEVRRSGGRPGVRADCERSAAVPGRAERSAGPGIAAGGRKSPNRTWRSRTWAARTWLPMKIRRRRSAGGQSRGRGGGGAEEGLRTRTSAASPAGGARGRCRGAGRTQGPRFPWQDAAGRARGIDRSRHPRRVQGKRHRAPAATAAGAVLRAGEPCR